MKSGKNTTELLICLIALLLTNVGAFVIIDHPVVHALTVCGDALIAAGYTFARTKLKTEEIKNSFSAVKAGNKVSITNTNSKLNEEDFARIAMDGLLQDKELLKEIINQQKKEK